MKSINITRFIHINSGLFRIMPCILAVFLSMQFVGCSRQAPEKGDISPERVVAVSKSIADLWLLSGGSLVGTTEDARETRRILQFFSALPNTGKNNGSGRNEGEKRGAAQKKAPAAPFEQFTNGHYKTGAL